MTRATPDQIARVVDLYRDAVARGKTPAVRTFAPAHGVGANTLYRALDAAGIRTAHKGRGKDGEPRSPTSWRHERPPQDELVDAVAQWGHRGHGGRVRGKRGAGVRVAALVRRARCGMTEQESRAAHIASMRTGISDEEIRERYPNAHAHALAYRRRRLDLSLEQAAADLGMTPDELTRIESGDLIPTDAQLVRISERYRWSLEKLRENFARAAQRGMP